MKTAIEIYENETGKKCPDNQIAYHEWHLDYVKWLELNVRVSNGDLKAEYMRGVNDGVEMSKIVMNNVVNEHNK